MQRVPVIYRHNYESYLEELSKDIAIISKNTSLQTRKYFINFAIKENEKEIKYRLVVEPDLEAKPRRMVHIYRGILYTVSNVFEGVKNNIRRLEHLEKKTYNLHFPKKWEKNHISTRPTNIEFEKYGKMSKAFYIAVNLKTLRFFIINRPVLELLDVDFEQPIGEIKMMGRDSISLRSHASKFPLYDITEKINI